MSYARRVRLTLAVVAVVIALSQAVYSQHNDYQTACGWRAAPSQLQRSTPMTTSRLKRSTS